MSFTPEMVAFLKDLKGSPLWLAILRSIPVQDIRPYTPRGAEKLNMEEIGRDHVYHSGFRMGQLSVLNQLGNRDE